MVIAAIQKLLYQAVRAGACGSWYSCGTDAKVQAVADQMHRTMVPEMGNWIGLAVDLGGAGGWETAIPKFLQEHQQPALACQRSAGVSFGKGVSRSAEGFPGAQETIPALTDAFVETLPRHQMVGGFFQSRQILIPVHNALQQISRQESPLGAYGGEQVTGLHAQAPSDTSPRKARKVFTAM
jgi:hypothetical protein